MRIAAGEEILISEEEEGFASDLPEETSVGQESAQLSADRAEPSKAAPRNKLIKQEKRLVNRCVRGEVAAWEELYEKHHPPLLRTITVLLGNKGLDRNLVDELAAQVWYSLVDNDGELLGRFCPKRGARLNTFIRAVAKDVTSRYFRGEQRRRDRELNAARASSGVIENGEDLDDSLTEFLGTLSESEREFTEAYLLSPRGSANGQDGKDGSGRSDASIWQFTRRIRVKLGRFFGS